MYMYVCSETTLTGMFEVISRSDFHLNLSYFENVYQIHAIYKVNKWELLVMQEINAGSNDITCISSRLIHCLD